MSITIDFDAKQLAKSKPLELHYLPAKIDGDGEANVDKYFNNYTRKNQEFGAGIVSNALRGYPLLGQHQTVPKGYKAVVLQETNQPLSDTVDRQLRLTGTFDNFTYWNYDKVPSNGDSYQQALQILNVAEALAAPIGEDEVQIEINRHQKQMAGKKENS